MRWRRVGGERGAVAVAAVALLARARARRGRGARRRSRAAAGRARPRVDRRRRPRGRGVLEARYGEAVDAGGTSRRRARRRSSLARAAAERSAARLGLTLTCRHVRARPPRPVAAGGARASPRARARGGLREGGHRLRVRRLAAVGFRLADVRGLAAPDAVVAAAVAQLGWPYVWGGESRAEGGFDCSGLVDYAFAAAGRPLGRLTAAGLQELARPLPRRRRPAARRPRLRRPSRASRRPRGRARPRGRGAAPRSARARRGDRRRRLDGRRADPRAGADPPRAPRARRSRLRAGGRCGRLIARSARAEQVPPALLAAQLEAESGFDASARSPAGAEGIAQFMPATWAGTWNPAAPGEPVRARGCDRRAGSADARPAERRGRRHRRRARGLQRRPGVPAGAWPAETRAYVARILRRFGGPATLGVRSGCHRTRGRGGRGRRPAGARRVSTPAAVRRHGRCQRVSAPVGRLASARPRAREGDRASDAPWRRRPSRAASGVRRMHRLRDTPAPRSCRCAGNGVAESGGRQRTRGVGWLRAPDPKSRASRVEREALGRRRRAGRGRARSRRARGRQPRLRGDGRHGRSRRRRGAPTRARRRPTTARPPSRRRPTHGAATTRHDDDHDDHDRSGDAAGGHDARARPTTTTVTDRGSAAGRPTPAAAPRPPIRAPAADAAPAPDASAPAATPRPRPPRPATTPAPTTDAPPTRPRRRPRSVRRSRRSAPSATHAGSGQSTTVTPPPPVPCSPRSARGSCRRPRRSASTCTPRPRRRFPS